MKINALQPSFGTKFKIYRDIESTKFSNEPDYLINELLSYVPSDEAKDIFIKMAETEKTKEPVIFDVSPAPLDEHFEKCVNRLGLTYEKLSDEG